LMDFDIVVAGAGPSGSALARTTAQAGLKVLLVEEHRQVGLPLQCSGFVTPRTLELANVPADGLVKNEIKGAVVRVPGSRPLTLGGDRVRALALNRVELDQRLSQDAAKAGATLYEETRLVDIQRVNGHLELDLWRGPNRKKLSVKTPLLVGADGWYSTVAKWMGFPRRHAIRCASVDGYLPGLSHELAQVVVGEKLAPGWFGWLIPLGNDQVRIGVGCDPSLHRSSPTDLLPGLFKALDVDFAKFQVESKVGGFIPIHSNGNGNNGHSRLPYSDNIMLIGDAAGQAKPTSGGGIYPGLVAAMHASRTALEAHAEGDFSASRLASYDTAWSRELGAEFEREADMRHLFLRLKDADFKRATSLLRIPGAQMLIRRYGDIDFQSPLFFKFGRLLPNFLGLVPSGLRVMGPWGVLRDRVNKTA
jgi:geranylgeranyl reductase family protein